MALVLHDLEEAALEIERLRNNARIVRLASYTVADLPDAAQYTGAQIFVSDETGGAVPAFSDGTNWRRVTDRTVVS